jgi:hypothetical protein
MLPEDQSSRPHRDIHVYRWLALSSQEISEWPLSFQLEMCSTFVDNADPVLLNLHRPYFTQALQETPADLQRHRYVPSVVATYRSAWRLSRGIALTWRAVPAILARLILPWSHALSAAVSRHLFDETIYT